MTNTEKQKTQDEIIEILKEILRPIRYDNGSGYIFMASLEGIDLLFPILPSIEGSNVYNLQDKKGNFVIQEELEIIKEHQEGYIKNYWTKPGTKNNSMIYPKITFVKAFHPLNLYIGTGMYIYNAKDQGKQYIKDLIQELNKQNPKDYIFLVELVDENITYTSTAVQVIIHPSMAIGEIMDNDISLNLNKLRVQPELHLSYNSTHPNGKSNMSKVSYFIFNTEWEWIVGTGFYTDDIDKEIAIWENQLSLILQENILTYIYILIIFSLFLFIIIYLINKFTQKTIQTYKNSVNEKENALKLLNNTLEEQVNKRTIQLQNLNEELTNLTNIDPLTQAYNRRYFYTMAKDLVAICKREKKHLSIAMIDIDDFKKINDTYGHDIGDKVLINLVQTVNKNLRESDLLVRFGGEEFIILFPSTTVNEATFTLEKIREIIQSQIHIQNINYTVSVGISEYYINDNSIEEALKRADEGLYIAKNDGKNRIRTQ